MSATRIQATCYSVRGLPEDDVNSQVWKLDIEWRGPGDRWAVLHLSRCLSVDGTWDYEPSPSNRDTDFIARHRFTLEEAKALAIEHYPKLVINGLRVEDGKLVRA
jgi:hypothetical protein